MTKTATQAPLDYEKTKAELVEIVQKLESGQVPLSQALQLWERGEELANICNEWLSNTKERVVAVQAENTAAESTPAAQ